MRIQYKVCIKGGNLLLEDNVDFIVNASNTVLMLGSGVSMSFKRHCGNELQTEMSSLLEEIHSTGYLLKQGDVIPSGTGKAKNFRHALHVAIMDYNKGVRINDKKPNISVIEKALNNIEVIILEYAKLHSKKEVSLVMPLMGCGFGGLNKEEVINIYQKFFLNKGDISDIVCNVILYGYSDLDVITLKNIIQGN